MRVKTYERKPFVLRGQPIYGTSKALTAINVAAVAQFTVFTYHATNVNQLIPYTTAVDSFAAIYMGATIPVQSSATDVVAIDGNLLLVGGSEGLILDKDRLVFQGGAITVNTRDSVSGLPIYRKLNSFGIYFSSVQDLNVV